MAHDAGVRGLVLRGAAVPSRAPPLPASPASQSPGVRTLPRNVKRCRENREHLERFHRLLHESPGQNLALTVLCVPYSLDSGLVREIGTFRSLLATDHSWIAEVIAKHISSNARTFFPHPRPPTPNPHRVTSLKRNSPPPHDHHRPLGIGLL